MGSLAFASAVGGAGEGLQRSAAHGREIEREDLDRAHDLQVEKQRQAFQVSREDLGHEWDLGMASTRVDAEERMATTANDRAVSLNNANNASLEGRNDATNESKEWIAALGMYESQTKSGGTNYRGWSTQVETIPGVLDSDTGTYSADSYKVMASKDGIPGMWNQVEDIMVLGSDQSNIKVPKDPEKRRGLEDLLIAQIGTDGMEAAETDFRETYGYLPIRYFKAIALKGNSGFNSWYKENRRSPPGGGALEMGADATAAAAPPAATDPLRHGDNLEEQQVTSQLKLTEQEVTSKPKTVPPGWQPSPPPKRGAIDAAYGAMGTGGKGAVGGVTSAAEGAGSALSRAARMTGRAIFGESE